MTSELGLFELLYPNSIIYSKIANDACSAPSRRIRPFHQFFLPLITEPTTTRSTLAPNRISTMRVSVVAWWISSMAII